MLFDSRLNSQTLLDLAVVDAKEDKGKKEIIRAAIYAVTDIEENFTSKGMIADCNIHNPTASDNEEQPHAHILLTLREIDEQGKWKPKSRKEYILVLQRCVDLFF
mgnify:CR=1 FL=1